MAADDCIYRLLTGLILVTSSLATAEPVSRGLIYGEGHAFFVEAPTGWVLDNASGVNQGLHAVFYPNGGSWKGSPAVMYVNTAQREHGKTLSSFVGDELERFRRDQSNLKISQGERIATLDGKAATVRYLEGDQWGNREAIGYIEERKVFVVIVLTARNPNVYGQSLDAFKALVRSYEFLTQDPGIATDQFDLIKQLAKDNVKTPAGARYDKAHGQAFAALHSGTMRECFQSIVNPDPSNFDILIRIAKDGRPQEILARPETNVALCLRKGMTSDRYPAPPKDRYWVDVDMTISP